MSSQKLDRAGQRERDRKIETLASRFVKSKIRMSGTERFRQMECVQVECSSNRSSSDGTPKTRKKRRLKLFVIQKYDI